MKYRSTRSCKDGEKDILVSFEEALIQGYSALDGGLFVPEELPRISHYVLHLWSRLDFPHLAFSILRLFIDGNEIPDTDLYEILCEYALDPLVWTNPTTGTMNNDTNKKGTANHEQDGNNQPVKEHCNHNVVATSVYSHIPVRWIGSDNATTTNNGGGTSRLYIAELFHGPTFCFKDLGMRALVGFLTYFAQKRNRRLFLLAATTGDTGPAAVQAVVDVAKRPMGRLVSSSLSSSRTSTSLPNNSGRSNRVQNHNTDVSAQPPCLVVHFPLGHITPFQQAQMTSFSMESNVRIVAYPGGGDDMDGPIQNILKQTGADAAVHPSSSNHANNSNLPLPPIVTGVNSYNIGRPLMQLVHYVWTYLRVVEQIRGISPHDRYLATAIGVVAYGKEDAEFFPTVDFVVPTGAMGNLVGGYMAKQMGVPIGQLHCGVNVNDVTHQILSTGNLPARAPVMHTTLSEAMNVQGIPYNMERILYYVCQGNAQLMQQFVQATTMTTTTASQAADSAPQTILFSLAATKWFSKLQADFSSARITDAEVCETIRWCYNNFTYVLDPHSAVGVSAALKILGYQQQQRLSSNPAMVVLATASPCKFENAVTTALGPQAWQAYQESTACPASARALILDVQQQQQPPSTRTNQEDAARAAQASGAIVYQASSSASLNEQQRLWEQRTLDLLKEFNDGKPVITGQSSSYHHPQPNEETPTPSLASVMNATISPTSSWSMPDPSKQLPPSSGSVSSQRSSSSVPDRKSVV